MVTEPPISLSQFDIRFQTEGATTFFGIPESPPPAPGAVMFEIVMRPNNWPEPPPKEHRFFTHFERRLTLSGGEPLACVDFPIYGLLEFIINDGSELNEWVMTDDIISARGLPIVVGGKEKKAIVDATLEKGDGRYAMFVRSTRMKSKSDPEAELVMAAVAVFIKNNRVREAAGLPANQSAVIPAILLTHTAPVFYLVPITRGLVDAIRDSLHPAEPATIRKFRPPVNNPDEYLSVGMKDLNNRYVIYQCVEAFKSFKNLQ